MSNTSTSYRFFPAVRSGYRPDTDSRFSKQLDVSRTGTASVTLDVTAAGEAGTTTEQAGIDLSIYGPGEVTNIDTDQVVRMEPEPETTEFPPNYFPLVEFDSPQLPWLFSPERADDQGRNRPWLCLVVVPAEAATYRPAGTGPLPVLETAAAKLPDASESWAWAHAQLVGGGDPESAFGSPSDRTVARLLCPRNLDPQTRYRACVVPTFEPGRRAGLGLDPHPGEDTAIALAWTDEDSVRLPVYHSWEFTTAERGDFESLARDLEPVELGSDVGYRPVDVSNPGPDALKVPADAATDLGTVEVGGALRATDAEPDTYDEQLRSTLRDLLNQPLDVVAETDYGAVAPPLYGQWHAGLSGLRSPGAADDDERYPAWFDALNADPRNRIVAGLGTQVVRDNQEELMASAWSQFGDIQRANDTLDRFQLSEQVLARRHEQLSTLSTGSLLGMSAPVHASAFDERSRKTVHGLSRDSDLPVALSSTTFRQITRPTGPIARRPGSSLDLSNLTTRLETGRLPQVTDGLGLTTELAVGGEGVSGQTQAEAGPQAAPGASSAGSPVSGVPAAGSVVDPGEPGELPTFASGDDLPEPAGRGDPSGDDGTAPPQGGAGDSGSGPDESGQPVDVARALTALDSLDEHAGTTDRAVSDLVAAVRSDDTAAVEKLAGTPPTVVDHCRSIRRNTFDPLTRALGKLLAEPRPASLARSFDRDAANAHLQELHAAQRRLEQVAEAAVRRCRADGQPAAAERSLDRAQQAIDEIQRINETLRSALTPTAMTAMSMTMGGIEPEGGVPGPSIGGATPAAPEIPPAEQLRGAVLDELDPQHRLPEYAAEVTGIPNLDLREEPVQEVVAAPSFTEPAYGLLAELDREYFLPGAGDVPRDSVGALQTNPAFVEAFMAGLNHEFARELRWREFPTDRRGTYFRRFWDRRGDPTTDPSNPEALADIEPMHTWKRGGLGTHGTGTDHSKLVLLLRGELLRRYPNTDIFAAKAVADGDDGEPDRVPALPDTHVTDDGGPDLAFPTFRGTLEPDVNFFGFELSPAEALYDPYHAADREDPDDHADEGWFFILQEPPGEARFGMDVGDESDIGSTPAGIATGDGHGPGGGSRDGTSRNGAEEGWDGLSWVHLVDADGQAPEDLTHVDVDGSRPGVETWSDGGSGATTWGYNSAHMARATWQRPVRVSIHADDILPDEPPDSTGWQNVQFDAPVATATVELPEGSE